MRHDLGPAPATTPGSPGEGPLVPLLGADAEADAVTLDTWHQALSSTLAGDIRQGHHRFCLYPPRRAALRLGPRLLADDRLRVPERPAVSHEHIALLEETGRHARYRSTIVTVASYEGADHGLLLFGALTEG